MQIKICISWRLVLSIKTKFEKLSMKDRILLYLIVVMIHSFIYIYYEEFKNYLSIYFIQPDVHHLIKKDFPSSSIVKLSDVELLNYFNKYSQKHSIYLKETKLNMKTIDIKMEGALSDMIHFLFVVLHNFKLEQLEISKEKETIFISVIFNTELFYDKIITNNTIQSLSNPFNFIKSENDISSTSIEVCAIINDEALINNKWYKKDDMIGDYQLTEINKNTISLKNMKTSKIQILRVFHE